MLIRGERNKLCYLLLFGHKDFQPFTESSAFTRLATQFIAIMFNQALLKAERNFTKLSIKNSIDHESLIVEGLGTSAWQARRGPEICHVKDEICLLISFLIAD